LLADSEKIDDSFDVLHLGQPMKFTAVRIVFVFMLLSLLYSVDAPAGMERPDESKDQADGAGECADRKLVRPSPKERVAVIKLLEQKPRPKTFIDADIKYLRALMEKAVWTGAERRILGEIWQEAMGQSLEAHESVPQ